MTRRARGRLLIGILIWMAACASAPPVVEKADSGPEEGEIVIFVTGHGWHTGIVVPADAIQLRFPALRSRLGDTPYMEFGWGDRAFYQAGEITAGLAVKAVLWPTESVMHVAAVPADVQAYFPRSEIHPLCLPPSRYAALLDFIAGSFRRDAKGALQPLAKGLYGRSHFFEATGSYTLFNTCNTWTAKGLKSAGFDIVTAFKATASSVMAYLRRMDPAARGDCPSPPYIPGQRPGSD